MSFVSSLAYGLRRRKAILLVLLVSTFTLTLYSYSTIQHNLRERAFLADTLILVDDDHGKNSEPSKRSPESAAPTSTVCKLPDPDKIDPRDPSVAQYIKELPSHFECPKSEDKISSSVDLMSGQLTLSGVGKNKCYYQTIKRIAESGDTRLNYSKLEPFKGISINLEQLAVEFISVRCFNIYHASVYTRSHAYPLTSYMRPNETQPTSASVAGTQGKPINVFLLIIESMSRITFGRFLPKTSRALEALNDKSSSVFHLKGLTKIADNSYPNMVALLTGKRAYQHELDKLGYDESTGPYDSLPSIWKEFAAKGYATSFLEDFPAWTLFNFLAKGFVQKPVDFYTRPFWLHLYSGREANSRATTSFCYHNRSKLDVLLGQARDFYAKGLKLGRPTFTFEMYVEAPHNDFNRMQLLDDDLSEYIKTFPGLEDTVLLLAGDHGNRFGNVLQTVVGRIEERMPFAALVVPKRLVIANPSIKTHLLANERKLTNWLDLHASLKDIVAGNFSSLNSLSSKQSLPKRAYSLWREDIPLERTCDDALIPVTYCVCDENRPLKVSLPIVQDAARALVGFLNEKVEQFEDCCKMSLSAINAAQILLPSTSVLQSKGFEQVLELVIEAKPSGGVFRAHLGRRVTDEGKWRLKGDITRISAYGDQGHCMKVRALTPFCFCGKCDNALERLANNNSADNLQELSAIKPH